MKNTSTKARTKSLKAIGKSKKPAEGSGWISRGSIFALSFFLTTGIVVFERSEGIREKEFVIGEPAPRTLFAPFELTYINEKSTQALRREKSESVVPVFKTDPVLSKDAREKARRLFEILAKFKVDKAAKASPPLPALPAEVSAGAVQSVLREQNNEIQKNVELVLERGLVRGIIDYPKKLELLESGQNEITILDPENKSEKSTAVRNILTVNEGRDFAEHNLTGPAKNRDFKNAVLDISQALMVSNLKFDEEETQFRRRKAAASVPAIQETVKKNELIVQRGMLITADEKVRLHQIQKKLAERAVLHKFLAAGIFVFMAYLMGFIYLFFLERKFLNSFRKILLVQTIFLLTVVLCKIFSILSGPWIYVMPTALAPLLAALLLDSHIAILSVCMMALLAAPLGGFRADVILAAVFSGIVVIFSAFRVRKRSHFLKVGIGVGVANFILLFAFQIFQDTSMPEAFQIALYGLANGICTLICFLILPVLESAFNLTTDITLLELSDLNHPLLKRMIVEAPGTYHHSLVVSTLAESACEAIGANALLARVGCYFHDIGKIARAEFFTENQAGKHISKHEKLTPTMSCLVIMNHVKDGIELGRQFKLKEPILRFIPEHQGTGIIYYFYRKALDHAKPEEKISPDDFRYPGPKPQSKETAVALLSDSTEAASRSLKDPSPESIRQLVRKIINDKFIDGQLDECDLTLLDLHKIQESFVYNLMAIFHTRVTYPVQVEAEDKPDLFEEDQFSKFRVDSKRPAAEQ